MDIPIHAHVRCIDEICGTVSCIILNPITDQITHIVVKGNSFPYIQRLVPVDRISETSSDMIQLSCNLYEYILLPEFIKSQFLIPDVNGEDVEIPEKLALPYAMVLGTITRETERIPMDELAIHRRSKVEAVDGRVGQVDEFLVEPDSNSITHLVLKEGHLWGKRDVSIPFSLIDHIEEDIVYLKITKKAVEDLPVLPIHRSKWK
jgi:sporulation protein YlmC with PRC-barrel domain